MIAIRLGLRYLQTGSHPTSAARSLRGGRGCQNYILPRAIAIRLAQGTLSSIQASRAIATAAAVSLLSRDR
jgi:hypothetical protein